MCQECEERLVYDKAGTPKLLANLSNQDHIAGVGHGEQLRVLPRLRLSTFLFRCMIMEAACIFMRASFMGTHFGYSCFIVNNLHCSPFTKRAEIRLIYAALVR